MWVLFGLDSCPSSDARPRLSFPFSGSERRHPIRRRFDGVGSGKASRWQNTRTYTAERDPSEAAASHKASEKGARAESARPHSIRASPARHIASLPAPWGWSRQARALCTHDGNASDLSGPRSCRLRHVRAAVSKPQRPSAARQATSALIQTERCSGEYLYARFHRGSSISVAWT